MNQNGPKQLQDFGELLSETRMREKISVAEICSDIHVSKRLYNGV